MTAPAEHPERDALVRMAFDVLHSSCPTTPAAEHIDTEPARAIAMGYLALALMPSAIWHGQDGGPSWPEVAGAYAGPAWDELSEVAP